VKFQSSDVEELRELLADDGTSEDTIWEWCLDRGGYIEVLAHLLDKVPHTDDA
tara:strand:- start:319 stop:477 length:159 start_codon:yes stop_codon:yes gene_type:complete